jgi:DNA-binding beta-propeller fold protein YncE
MISRSNSSLRLAGLALAGALVCTGTALAAPHAYVVNAYSHTVSVVDLGTGATVANVPTWDGYAPNAGREPKDVLVDPRSGRVFAAARAKLAHFEGFTNNLADDLTIQDEASGLALDDAGRRLFVCHEQIGSYPNGFVTRVPISGAGMPGSPQQFEVPGVPDLRAIAWDKLNRRVYVVDDDGPIARTGADNMSFTRMMNVSAPNPGGILADPSGGIWVTSRGTPAILVRIRENGTSTSYAIPNMNVHPRGMSWDRMGNILIAVDDASVVKRFNPASGAFSDAMSTEARPYDVAMTFAGNMVSANRKGDMVAGSVTLDGQTRATTQIESIAIDVHNPHLTPDKTAHSFCYNRTGDRSSYRFTLRNTRMDGARMDLGPIQIGGMNPGNYALVGSNGCAGARLNSGDTCQFTLEFTASGPSNQPPPLFGGSYQVPYWPAEASVASTDGQSAARISLRGGLSLNPCTPLPPLIVRHPRYTLGGL